MQHLTILQVSGFKCNPDFSDPTKLDLNKAKDKIKENIRLQYQNVIVSKGPRYNEQRAHKSIKVRTSKLGKLKFLQIIYFCFTCNKYFKLYF